MRLTLTAILALLFLLILSCNSARNISGTYHSNFAIGGFFGTRIVLNKDSTFTYRMRGDLLYDTAFGQFQIRKKFVILTYRQPSEDTSYGYGKETIQIHELFTGSHNLRQPEKYLIGHKKLYLTDSTGHKVKRQWGYSRTRKFIFVGKHWYMKKYYLKRID